MTYSSFPFEQQTTDETQFSNLFRELLGTGVCASADSTALQVAPSGTNLVASFQAGKAMVRGFMFISDSVASLSFDSVASGSRIDTVVLRLDPAANTILPVVVKGNSVSGPALTQTDTGVYDLALADVTVLASGAITVLDRRNFTGHHTGIWTTALRPATPRKGKLGYNTTLGTWEFWNGAAWSGLLGVDSGWIPCTMSGFFDGFAAATRKIGSVVYFRARGNATVNDYASRTFCIINAAGHSPFLPVRHFSPRTGSATAAGAFIYVLAAANGNSVQMGRIGSSADLPIDIHGDLSWLAD